MKDLFSEQSHNYAKYRPLYCKEFYEYLFNVLPNKKNAWDCGTGNGQVAYELSKEFENVFATDISKAQLSNALPANNVHYSLQPAETTTFPENYFDFIIVAQAIHWFDFDKFYSEVKRTANPHAIICVMGHAQIEVTPDIDAIIFHLYEEVLGNTYWEPERKYVDEKYLTIPFPFHEIATPVFEQKLQWTIEHLEGYLNTWSAVKKYISIHGASPVPDTMQKIKQVWGKHSQIEITFPLLLRLGKVH